MEIYGRDYRALLRTELASRQTKNAQYSMRSFAQALGLNPTTLSLVLQNKRTLSAGSIHRLIEKLDLEPEQSKALRAMILSIDGDTAQIRLQASQELEAYEQRLRTAGGYRDLSISAFKVIADWYNLAILEVLELPAYSDAAAEDAVSWVARQLAISTVQVQSSLEHLEALGLISFTANGKPLKNKVHVKTGDHVPSAAIRSHHRQYMEKAMDALKEQAFAECDFSGIVVPVDPDLLPEAKAAIQHFRETMNILLQGKRATKVYRLSIGLFNLTRAGEKK